MVTNSQEDSDDVGSDKETRDNKSRYILRTLRIGQIHYCTNGVYGRIRCPFCVRTIAQNLNSLINHAKSIGMSPAQKPLYKAKHAAFGVFLIKYVKGHEPFYLVQPPPEMTRAKKPYKGKKAKK